MHRILAIGDGAVPTGLGRVMASILGRLTDRYEIHHLAVNYHGDPHPFPWRLYPTSIAGDEHGCKRVEELVSRVEPDLVFLLSDLDVQRLYLAELEEFLPELPVVTYTPIDAEPVSHDALVALAGVRRFVVYTQFAKSAVERSLHGIRAADDTFRFPAVEVLPHGVDTDAFNPHDPDALGLVGAARRQETIRRVHGEGARLENAFIVLNANRNQIRKRIDITLKGFAEFARGKPPNVLLHLHMGRKDLGWDIVELARRLGIGERLLRTETDGSMPAVSDERLNDIYNASVVGVNTSIGEGWGLVSFEHAAAGGAQIVPRHSACAELWEGGSILIEPSASLTTERVLTEGQYVSPCDVAKALNLVYDDPELLTRLARASHAIAVRPEYRWESIADAWSRVFDDEFRSD